MVLVRKLRLKEPPGSQSFGLSGQVFIKSVQVRVALKCSRGDSKRASLPKSGQNKSEKHIIKASLKKRDRSIPGDRKAKISETLTGTQAA